MHDFGNLVYSDVHKTGSTYISRFLLHSCNLTETHPLIFSKHSPISLIKDDVFYFTSIRNPIAMYESLYRYGCDGKGMIQGKARKHGILYNRSNQDYNRFVDVFTEIEECGLMTYRFLNLNTVGFPSRIKTESVDSIAKDVFTNFVIKMESMNQDLLELTTKEIPQYFNEIKVKEFLDSTPKVNKSTKVELELTKSSLIKIKDKEKLIFDLFY